MSFNPGQRSRSQSHHSQAETNFNDPSDYAGVFADGEESILYDLQRAFDNEHKEKEFLEETMKYSVTLVYANRWGSALVRADEASYILRARGVDASSLHCETFCKIPQAKRSPFVVHVKQVCHRCKVREDGSQLYIHDPVDVESAASDMKIFTGSSKYRDELNMRRQDSAILLPHHHSNFQNRRIRDFDLSSPKPEILSMVFAGDDLDLGIRDRLAQCLKNILDETSLANVDPFAKILRDVECDKTQVQGPSFRGDCFAMKLAQFDIGIVWRPSINISASLLKVKPPQRLANTLAVGLPVVADSSFASHRDAGAYVHHAIQLAASEKEMCNQVGKLVSDHSLRRKASEEALTVAEKYYSPGAIADQYINAFQHFSAHSPLTALFTSPVGRSFVNKNNVG